jgi:hypothetical protein
MILHLTSPCRTSFVILVLFLFASPTHRTSHAVNDVLAYYPLDGDARDSSSNRLDGIASGTFAVTNRFGSAGSALRFNGTSSFVDLGNREEFNFPGDFTVSAWVRLNATSAGRYFISKYAFYGIENREPRSYGFGLDGNSRLYGFVSQGSGYADVAGGPSLHDGRWHAVTIVYDFNFGLRTYVDGALVGQKAAPGLAPFTNSVPLMFGKAFSGQHFTGDLDDVRFYNRVLTSDQVRTLFQADAGGAGIVIAEQPKGQWIELGRTATFTVVVAGPAAGAAKLQWLENGMEIPGATNGTFTTWPQGTLGQKSFSVKIQHESTTLLSEPALLTVGRVGQNGLLAHWTFDEEFTTNVIDQAGTYTGRVVNAQWTAGRVGTGALSLNGTDAYMRVGAIGSALGLEGSHYTFSWWQKWNGPNGRHQVVLAMDDGEDFSGGYQAFLFLNSPEVSLVHSDGVNQQWVPGVRTDSAWHQYAFTFDGAFLRLYKDGTVAAQQPRTTAIIQDGDDPLVIGAISLQNGTIVNFFNGTLDDVRIYSRALTPQEITELGPQPEIIFTRQPSSYRIGIGAFANLSVETIGQATTNEITYQWEENGVPIAGATNAALTVSGSINSRNYRVLARAGNLQTYSTEATVIAVAPSEARLLLQLDFEGSTNGIFADSTGNFTNITGNVLLGPGRVGSHAATIASNAMIRVPAAATDLELVGTSYTIAWWLKPATTPSISDLFTMGQPLNGTTGYGAQIEGQSVQNRLLRIEHRNGRDQAVAGTLRSGTTWVHIAVVYDGVYRSVYTNGVATTSPMTTVSPLLGSGQHDLYIGWTNGTRTVGSVDDFRIYNYALASDEVAALANIPEPRTEVHLGIAQDGTSDIALTWPASNVSFRLEYSDILGTNSVWRPMNVLTTSSNQTYRVLQPASGEVRFYRLRRL